MNFSYYHFDKNNQFTRSTPAKINPRNPGKPLGSPASSTLIKPSDKILNGECIGVWDGKKWREAYTQDESLAIVYTEEQLAEMARNKLLEVKRLKAQQLIALYDEEKSQPVHVGEHTYLGGESSAYSLDGQYRLTRDYIAKFDPTVTTVKFYDASGNEHEVPLDSETEIDAMDIIAQVTMRVSVAKFKYAKVEKAIREAETIAAVEAITWPTI